MTTEPSPGIATAFTHEGIAAAIRAAAPLLPADDLAAAANTAAAAWRYAADAGLGLRPEVETAGAVWARAHRAGYLAGHAATAQQVTVAVLQRAEPARLDMSAEHLQRANRLQAARLDPQTLRDYLESHHWQLVTRLVDLDATHDFGGGLIYQRHGHEVLVPPPGNRDHAQRMHEAVAGIERVEDRSAAAVLAELVGAPPRPPLSHDALRFLERCYRKAVDLFPTLNELSFPDRQTITTAMAQLPQPRSAEETTPAGAAQLGWVHGYPAGLGVGARLADSQLRSQLARLPVSLRNAPLDGVSAELWAIDTVRAVADRAGAPGSQPTPAIPAAAGRTTAAAFPTLRPALVAAPPLAPRPADIPGRAPGPRRTGP